MRTAVTGNHQQGGFRGLAPLAIAALVLAISPAAGQTLAASASTAAKAPASPAPDWLGRGTPRTAMYQFLQACHSGDYAKAAQYLDLSHLSLRQQAEQGPQRARELAELLDRDPHFELEALSNAPEGNPGDQLAPDLDQLASFVVDGRPVTLTLQRVNRNGSEIWLVSRDAVSRLPDLQSVLQRSPIERRLPAVLVQTRLLGTPVWVWIALAAAAVILAYLSRLFSAAALAIVKPIVQRYVRQFSPARLKLFAGPVRLLLAIAVFRGCMEFAPPSALMRDAILRVLQFLFVFGAASFVMRAVDAVSDRFISKLNPRERAMSYSVLPLGVRFAKICIFCLALLALLRQWGIDVTAVLAGVGVGGLAVALAAQRTIENLFGGISVISDRPVLVGDFCQFGGQTGTVEDIGLRSTRIRTLDRTLVTVPNSQFSTMTLENFSRRDRFLFKPSLLLRRDTPAEKIEEAINAISALLIAHEQVDATGLPVRFTKINVDSFSLELFSYVLTTDGTEFLRIQSELLLAIIRRLEEIGVGLAVPFQESVTAAADPFEQHTAKEASLLN